MNWLKKMLTGLDNETPDVMRHLGLFGGIAGLFFTGWEVVAHGGHFSWSDYGIGFGSFCAGVGAAIGMKSHTEPKP